MSAGLEEECDVDLGNPKTERLPSALRKIVEEELGETESLRSEAVTKLGQALSEEADLSPRLDTEFLLRYLRVRKYDLDAALKTVKNYYRKRADPSFCIEQFVPSSVEPLAKDLNVVLPQRDCHGRVVLLAKGGMWEPKHLSFQALQRAGLICLEHVARDPSSQIAGISIIVDYEGLTLARIFGVSFGQLKQGLEYLQECIPVRVKAVHIVRQSYVFNILFMIARPFLKRKIIERFHFHGYSFDELHKEIPATALPKEYGGQAPTIDFNHFWRNLDEEEALYEQDNRYGYHTGRR